MTKINVITPPDVLHNQSKSFFLVQPSNEVRNQFQLVLQEIDIPCNIYLYDPQDSNERMYDWLLNIANMADYVIVDVDNLSAVEHNLASYLISLPQTFYLTKDEVTPYNMLNVNRVYDLDWLAEKLKEE